jgi:hypothetical protein
MARRLRGAALMVGRNSAVAPVRMAVSQRKGEGSPHTNKKSTYSTFLTMISVTIHKEGFFSPKKIGYTFLTLKIFR